MFRADHVFWQGYKTDDKKILILILTNNEIYVIISLLIEGVSYELDRA